MPQKKATKRPTKKATARRSTEKATNNIEESAAQSMVERIRKKLAHYSTEPPPPQFLDTGSSQLNMVVGVRDKGMPYGKLIELHGMESHGKTALGMTLLALAQSDGAQASYIDAESSYDPLWAERRGIDSSALHLIQPYVGRFGKEKIERLISAEEMCLEAEKLMEELHDAGAEKQVIMLDSITALLSDEESRAGLTARNMRTKLSLSSFIGSLMRRWTALCHSYNTTAIFINQLRVNPNTFFGDPSYTPGGYAPKFFCHVRVRIMSKKKIEDPNGATVGIKGKLRNVKNKVGGIEGAECLYKMQFSDDRTLFAEIKR